MSGRDIKIPFGPDKTGGLPLDAIPVEGEAEPYRDPFEAPLVDQGNPANPATLANPATSVEPSASSLAATLPSTMELPATQDAARDAGWGESGRAYEGMPGGEREPGGAAAEMQAVDMPADEGFGASVKNPLYGGPADADTDERFANEEGAAVFEGAAEFEGAEAAQATVSADGTAPIAYDAAAEAVDAPEYHPGGITDEEATAQGMDPMQMSILALKDSIDQGRELKEREKDRKELAEALEADHVELADRENILANYQTLVAEQDAIIADCTQRREAAKAELSQLTVALEQNQTQLEALREQQAQQLQPLETDLGRARAAADRAKNDERSRRAELNSAESELRKANEQEANSMAIARHDQAKAAYDEARAHSNQAKDQLAQIQKAFDEAKQRFEQARGPLERSIKDITSRMEQLKEAINSLGEQLTAARNRRQYCDTVYQFPNETAQMRSEVEQAEALARQMDAENEVLREQLAQSKKKARTAKRAIALVIAIIIVIIVAFVVVSGR